MISTGMIYQYDSTEGTGLIMLTDGQTKEFSTSDWKDTLNTPSVGQRVSYESDTNGIYIKVANEEDVNSTLSEDPSINNLEECTSVDDYINYFTSMKYKIAKDLTNDATRTITLRFYTPEDFGEAIIEQVDSKITVTQTRNGKAVITD